MTNTLLVLSVCALLMVPTLLFLLILQPIWTFIEVCSATLLGRGAKIIWLITVVLFAIVASVPYALFVSSSAALRRVTMASLILLGIAIGIGYAAVRYDPELREQFARAVAEAQASYADVTTVKEVAKRFKW